MQLNCIFWVNNGIFDPKKSFFIFFIHTLRQFGTMAFKIVHVCFIFSTMSYCSSCIDNDVKPVEKELYSTNDFCRQLEYVFPINFWVVYFKDNIVSISDPIVHVFAFSNVFERLNLGRILMEVYGRSMCVRSEWHCITRYRKK